MCERCLRDAIAAGAHLPASPPLLAFLSPDDQPRGEKSGRGGAATAAGGDHERWPLGDEPSLG